MKRINNISKVTESAILRKTAFGLPNRPSASGMKTNDIKKAFYTGMIDDEDSVLTELKRIVEEVNEIIDYLEGKIDQSNADRTAHEFSTNNPHKVTKAQVGLEFADDTADIDKPVSTAQRAMIEQRVQYSDVVDNLTSSDTEKPLSAKQGKVIKGLLDDVSSKADESIVNMTMDNKTGIITITKNNGDKIYIDLPIEMLVRGGHYDDESKSLVLDLESGETFTIPVADLVNEYYGDEITIHLEKGSDGKLKFGLSESYKTKINGIEANAQKNVQSDWNQSDDTADDFIKNKPTIPEGVVVENNLTSESTTNSLSANQGRLLNGKITNNTSRISELESDNIDNQKDISDLKNADANNVKLTGNQTIEGEKTYNGNVIFNGSIYVS